MNAQQIRNEIDKNIQQFNADSQRGGTHSSLLSLLLYGAVMEVAAQLAELNENKRVTVRYAGNYGGEPKQDRWECPTCHTIVYSEAHFRQHLDGHEERDKKTGGAR